MKYFDFLHMFHVYDDEIYYSEELIRIPILDNRLEIDRYFCLWYLGAPYCLAKYFQL